MDNIRIGEVLEENGYINEHWKIEEALDIQKKNGGRLGAILINLGYITERNLLKALGKRLSLFMINFSGTDISIVEDYDIGRLPDIPKSVDMDSVSKIPEQIALKYNIIALFEKNARLCIAMNDPLDFYAQEDIKQITGMQLEIFLAEYDSINNAISVFYSQADAKTKIAAKNANTSVSNIETPSVEMFDEEDDAPVINLINRLLEMGNSKNVSDIHIEPFEENTSVRVRIDGMIIDYITLSKSLHNSVIARIKIMSNLDIAEKRLPQDGHFKTIINDSVINIRVSVIPTVFGEKAVMRFLASDDRKVDNSEYFGMDKNNFNIVNNMLASPYGIIYITGPTGSGKTTTLYMMLEQLAKKQINISTIEDPVEKNIKRVNQMQVNTVSGLTFDIGLRALLRQDPDVIMVGETRDSETASISVRSAITGHLVLSTLHTNNAVSSIVRLRDMGVPDYLIASSLTGAIAQRLIRKVCPHCSKYEDITDSEKILLGDNNIIQLKRAKGCKICNNTGYLGRIAVHEVFFVDKNIRHMIADTRDIQDIYDYIHDEQHMLTLRESAMKLLYDGITTVEEVIRVTYGM